MKKITIIAASDQKNLALAKEFEQALVALKIETEVLNLIELELPLYTQPAQEKIGVPASLMSVLPKLEASTGFVFVAPEYNGGVPPVLSNFIAWTSRASKDWRVYFNEKPAAIATHSGSGGLQLLTIMRTQLSYIGLTVLGRQILTHFQKPLNPESLDAVIKQLVRLS
jgi:chromate reductase